MSDDEMTVKVLEYIQENLRPDDLTEEIDEHSQLFELGVLDSLRTAMLLNFIREELATVVPPLMIEYRNFRDVVSIAAMLRSLTAAEQGEVA